MKTFGKFSFVLALMALGLSFSTLPAAAQSMVAGTFKLPMEAHWGPVVLPAGDYSFTVEQRSSSPIVAIRNANRKGVGMFLSRSVSQIAESENASLILTRSGEGVFVSSFQLGSIGLALEYGLPRSVESAMASPEHGAAVVVATAAH
jgi:hypothetical protein